MQICGIRLLKSRHTLFACIYVKCAELDAIMFLFTCRQLEYLKAQLAESRSQMLQNTGQAASSVVIHRQDFQRSKT